MKTLFDPDYRKYLTHEDRNLPYSLWLEFLDGTEPTDYPEDEVCIFQHVLEHERILHEPRGYLFGDLTLELVNQGTLNICEGKPFQIPNWVEEDAIQFKGCKATGILLMEKASIFRSLCASEFGKRSTLLFAAGVGIPRAGIRRILHRLQKQFKLPVYLLADNDTWGYFIYSLLKRGTMNPGDSCPYLAIEDLRFLGVRAGDWKQFGEGGLISWKVGWNDRLHFLRQYPCFQSEAWQSELETFSQQSGKFETEALHSKFGVEDFAKQMIEDRISQGEWLS